MATPAPESADPSDRPLAIVIRTAGTNCDAELIRAFEIAGADAESVHLDSLCRDPANLLQARLIGLPGGFSYGDDVASGRIFAMRVREALADTLRQAVQSGACIIGICNGFQVLVQSGLLPGEASVPGAQAGHPGPAAHEQAAALIENRQGRFVDDWVRVVPAEPSVCVWTQGLAGVSDDAMQLPIANGQGRFLTDDTTLAELESTGRIVLRYAEDVNGSAGRVAGICDATGRVFGLMPHPERYLDWNRHPYWTRLSNDERASVTPGLQMFINAVRAVTPSSVGSPG